MEQGEVTFTYSGVLTRGHKKIICVRFERIHGDTIDYAEGIIPDCIMEKESGFSREEIIQMQDYLKREKHNIIEEAKKINNIKNWF